MTKALLALTAAASIGVSVLAFQSTTAPKPSPAKTTQPAPKPEDLDRLLQYAEASAMRRQARSS